MGEIDRFLLGFSSDPKVLRGYLLHLLRSGLWGYWRERFTPRGNLSASILFECWFQLNVESDRKNGIPIEEWRATLEGLTLDSTMLRRIWPSEGNRFPWIAPFEFRQVADLAGCAADLKTLGSLCRRFVKSGTGGLDVQPSELEEILDANCHSPNQITRIAKELLSDAHKIIHVIAEDLWDWVRVAEAIIHKLDNLRTAIQRNGQLSHDDVFLLTKLDENADRIPSTSESDKRGYREEDSFVVIPNFIPPTVVSSHQNRFCAPYKPDRKDEITTG